MTAKQGRLAGKKTLITAAGQGIGRTTAELWAAEGAQVIASDINDDALTELGAIDGITTLKLDLTDAGAVEVVVAEVGALDVLFNYAGYVADGAIECDENDWDFSFDLNVKAMYRLARLTLPAMLKQCGGSIITCRR